MFEGRVVAIHPRFALTLLHLCSMNFSAKFVPTTSCMEFNLMNFMGHVEVTELCARRHDHHVLGSATSAKTDI